MYTKTGASLWIEMEEAQLSDRAKLLLLYLITCEHRNMIGLYRLPFAYAASDLGWEVEEVSEGVRELTEKGFVAYDGRFRMVLVRIFLRENPLENPNAVKAAEKLIRSLPETALLGELEELLEGFGNRYETLCQTVADTENRIQKTESRKQKTEDRKQKAERMPGAEAPARRLENEMAQQVEDPADGVVERLPLNSGEYEVTEPQVQEWARLYPAVDVVSELRKMRGWLLANPSKRKTKSGIARFVNSWLAREQDRGPVKTRGTKQDSFDIDRWAEASIRKLMEEEG